MWPHWRKCATGFVVAKAHVRSKLSVYLRIVMKLSYTTPGCGQAFCHVLVTMSLHNNRTSAKTEIGSRRGVSVTCLTVLRVGEMWALRLWVRKEPNAFSKAERTTLGEAWRRVTESRIDCDGPA